MATSLLPEERDLLALRLVPGLGPRLTAALLERFGTAAAVLRATTRELLEIPYLGQKVAEQIAHALRNPDIEQECRLLEQHGVTLRRLGTPDYPAALATIPTPPPLLFVRGTLAGPEERAVAIVGSRTCTSYGRRVAERIAHDLAQAGWTIVSGLARGIDGYAHRGALLGKGRTIAVLAGGLSRIYPPEHAGLADEVAAAGALVSEAAMRMEPMAGMFPARNRIISGLSRAVVVVEANDKSGALITTEHAAEQGREVFAVPGPVDSAASAGTLRLLRDGAKLVRNAADILEDLQGLPSLTEGVAPASDVPAKPAGLSGIEEQLWDFLDERRTVDELTRHSQLPAGELARRLMTMELKKHIRRLPGNWYERA
jgi:DNA processing protein